MGQDQGGQDQDQELLGVVAEQPRSEEEATIETDQDVEARLEEIRCVVRGHPSSSRLSSWSGCHDFFFSPHKSFFISHKCG